MPLEMATGDADPWALKLNNVFSGQEKEKQQPEPGRLQHLQVAG